MPSAIDDIRAAVKAAAGQTGEQPAAPAGAPAAAEAEKPKAAKKPKKPKADAKPAELKKYRVSLVHNPELEVDAEDRLDAIEKYNAACGIIATIHKHSVKLVKDATPDDEDDGEE